MNGALGCWRLARNSHWVPEFGGFRGLGFGGLGFIVSGFGGLGLGLGFQGV